MNINEKKNHEKKIHGLKFRIQPALGKSET